LPTFRLRKVAPPVGSGTMRSAMPSKSIVVVVPLREIGRSVAFARQRRRIALAQHDRVQRMREGQIERGEREPVLHGSRLIRCNHIQVPAIAIEHRLAHSVSPSVMRVDFFCAGE
jgi:hypothetical protein